MSRITQQQEEVNEKLQGAYQRLVELEEKQKKLEADLNELLTDRNKYALLSEIVDHIDKLAKLGAAKLFWGHERNQEETASDFQRISQTVAEYDNKVNKLSAKRDQGRDQIRKLSFEINGLNEKTLVLSELEEEVKNEFVIEREMETQEFHPMIMPWTRQGEDEKRFRKILLVVLLWTVLLGYLIPLWQLPIPDRDEVIEIPERLAKLVIEKKPPPPPKVEKPIELPKEKRPREKAPKAKTKKAKVARKKAESAGLLAFKDNFSELMDTDVDKKLGAQARISTKGKTAKRTQRSIITSQAASGTSGGINTAALSRDVGGAGKGIEGVGFSRVESSIGTDFAGEERPLSSGPGPSRTDEEIQIVFDRYKAALYRIYNRQLRTNPSLQGKMVLRITIQPDGSVTLAKVESSDMDSPELNSKIVARVKRFNFGAKDGVPAVTILYPIDFLPAS